MTPTQIELVKSTWKKVVPISTNAAELFYDRLFALDPLLRPMFKSDLRDQGRKLMQMIGVVVSGLNKLEEIVPKIEALGRGHAGYGVRPEHYDTVGAALLWTLKQGLDEAFTPDVELAWAEAYTLLAATMQRAAIEPAPAPT